MAGIHRQWSWRQTFTLLVVLFAALGDDMATATAPAAATRVGVPARLRRVQKTGNALIRGHENAIASGNVHPQPSKNNSFDHTRRPQRESILPIARPHEVANDPDTSNADIANEDEQLQIATLRQTDSTFDKCYGMLEEVSEDHARVTQNEYVKFLNQLTNGEISPTADLNSIDSQYATTWHDSTCPRRRPCAQEDAYISLEPENEDALEGLISLCAQAMSLALTTVTVTFEFTIKYNSDLITTEDVSQCLEIASENLVLDSLGCDFEGIGNTVVVSDGINDNSPKRKLKSSSALASESVVSLESPPSSSSVARPLANSGRSDTPLERRTQVDDWEEVDEKVILALLMNERKDSRFLDMDMSMQPTPPAPTLQPSLPPSTRPPTPERTAVPTASLTAVPSSPPATPPTTSTTPAPTPSLATPAPSPESAIIFPPSDCPYVVEAKVDSVVEFPCEGLQEDITCSIVRMTITVTAPQDIAPSEDELKAQVIATLREAINGDGFEAYFPPGCSVTG